MMNSELIAVNRRPSLKELNLTAQFNNINADPLPASTQMNSRRLQLRTNLMQKTASLNRIVYRHYLKKNHEKCFEIIQKMIATEPTMACEFALITRGIIRLEQDETEAALEDFLAALQLNPSSPRLLYLIGRAYYLLGEHKEAVNHFMKGIDVSPNNWRMYFWCARALYYSESKDKGNHLAKAEDILSKYPRLNKSPQILSFIGKIYIEKDTTQAAIDVLNKAIELEPDNLALLNELGSLFLRIKQDQKAFSCLGRALTYNPTHLPSILAATTVLQRNNDYEVALSKYKTICDSWDQNAAMWNNLGMCFFGKGKYVLSIGCLKKANYQCPLDERILFNLAVSHRAMYQFASAYHFIVSALNIQNKNVLFLMTTAIILCDLDDFGSARKAYQRALALDPANILVRLNFATFEYRRGNLGDAATLIEQVNVNSIPNRDTLETKGIIASIHRLTSCIQNTEDAVF